MAIVDRDRFAAIAVVIIALCGAQVGCAERKVGATLTYVVDRDGDRDSTPTDMRGLVHVVNARLAGLGNAHALTGEHFAVDVFGDADAATLAAVRRRVSTLGTLQFRILAAPKFSHHRKIIDLAKSLPKEAADADIVKLGDKSVARWVECNSAEFADVDALRQRGLAARQVGDRVQALMLIDDGVDVMGDSIESINPDIDEFGKPDVSFSFNDHGAILFGKLTGDHVPTRSGEQYNLGIVLDNRLLTAPTIESKITDRARISGNMTDADVDYLVAVLRAGRLPYAVREIAADVREGAPD